MEFFVYPFRLGEIERYMLWFTNDVDGVLINENGQIATFSAAEAAITFANGRELQVTCDPSSLLDLRWIQEGRVTPDNIDCKNVLNAWNFFADVAASLPGKAVGLTAQERALKVIYEKLFWGNNLPAVTPLGERYDPTWSEEEAAEIQTVLRAGLDLFASSLSPI